jgi:rhodanese-related sulfurtransferase
MRLTITTLFMTFLLAGFSQNPKGFDGMCKENIQGTVPTATPTQLKFEASKNPKIVILDSRERKEYNISHIKNAIYVGYNNFDITALKGIDKSDKIYVYCSVGYRSEKIGEKLMAAGYSKVFNLYGGIFNWSNNGYPLVDENGKPTKKVHGYDKNWAQWINEDQCSPVLK